MIEGIDRNDSYSDVSLNWESERERESGSWFDYILPYTWTVLIGRAISELGYRVQHVPERAGSRGVAG